jgi:hypothetical protein
MHSHTQSEHPLPLDHAFGPALKSDEQVRHVFNEASIDVVIAPFPSFLKKHAFPYMLATITGGVA